MSLITLRLQRLLRWVRLVNGLQVERSLLADRLEDGGTLVGGDLLVAVVVDNEPGDVLDDTTNWGDVAILVLEDNANLGASDVEAPEPLAVTLNEA